MSFRGCRHFNDEDFELQQILKGIKKAQCRLTNGGGSLLSVRPFLFRTFGSSAAGGWLSGFTLMATHRSS